MEEVMAEHSSLGASSAERWMNCPGSTALIEAFELPETDEPEYRKQGIAGHAAAADCLARDIDAWEIVGDTYEDYIITAEMGEAIQLYLDRCRASIGGGPSASRYHGQHFFIEAKLAAPDIHEKMFGTVDFGALAHIKSPMSIAPGACPPMFNWEGGFLDITDLKMGQGITVEAYDNPQMKYYAFMLIHTKFQELPDDFPVRLSIVQPRAFHPDGPIREWWTTVGYIKAWVVADLLPAMHSTDKNLQAGEWCRFCPAKLTCPLVRSLFLAASNYDPAEIVEVGDEALGASYKLIKPVKFYLKALEEETYRRLMLQKEVPNAKLVNKRADRIFKTEAIEQVGGEEVAIPIQEAIRKRFGDKGFTAPELKSPAQLSEVSEEAKKFVAEYAYMPVTGLTVALADDKRTRITIQSARDRFAVALKEMETEAN
jgi:Protein of unknown function (DUF2800)